MKYKIPNQIESKRLNLRFFKEDDWKDLYPYYSDPESTRYTIARTLDEGETWRAMALMVGHWTIKSYGPYALEEKSTSKVIGIAGLWFPGDWPEPEIKWGLAKNYRGKGYASEAVRRIKSMVKEYLPEMSLISVIHPENDPSIRLALAVGCIFEKTIDFRGGVWNVYRHQLDQ